MKSDRNMTLFSSFWRFAVPVAVIALVFIGSACGGAAETENAIRDAEMALANGDMEVATSVADHITNSSADASNLSATQLARLSIVYAQLAEFSNDDTNTAVAVNYCRAALKENADSTEAYYSQLPPDQVGYARALMLIVQNIENPRDISESIEPDSMAFVNDPTFASDSTSI